MKGRRSRILPLADCDALAGNDGAEGVHRAEDQGRLLFANGGLDAAAQRGTSGTFRLAVYGAIAALPALYRESFVLKHVEGLDYQQMSEILGVSGDTLKMRVYKARTMLCRTLAHLGR